MTFKGNGLGWTQRLTLWILGFALGALFFLGLNSCMQTPAKPEVKTLTSPQPPNSQPLSNERSKEVTKLVLSADRIVEISGPIFSSEATVQRILELGQSPEPLYVILNSPGGSVLDGAMIISAIEAAKGPVYTVCNQLCASMAAMIFEYGTQRYAVDRSFIMFHPASGGSEGEVDKMVSRLGSIQRYIGKMEAHVAKRAGVSFERYKQLAGVELWIDAEDAVNGGFADKIVSVVLPEQHNVSIIGNNSASSDYTTYTTGLPFIKINPMIRPWDINWRAR